MSLHGLTGGMHTLTFYAISSWRVCFIIEAALVSSSCTFPIDSVLTDFTHSVRIATRHDNSIRPRDCVHPPGD